MLVEFPEQNIDDFIIPSFTLGTGEIVVINFPNDGDSHKIGQKLIAVLTRKLYYDGVNVVIPLRYVEHLWRISFWDRIFPITIQKYHKRFANRENPAFKRIYEDRWLKPKTYIQSLGATQRRKLSLFTTLSFTTNIILDLVGVDPLGSEEIFGIVKNEVNNGGAAVLIDHFGVFKDECTAYVIAKRLNQ